MKSINTNKRVSRPAIVVAAGLCAAIGIIIIAFASAATALVGDINNDGKVDIFDLSLLLSKWGTADAASDLNASGKVDVFDLSILLSHWGQVAASPTPTPIPSGTPGPISGVSSSTPCVGAPAPAKWKHIVVLLFENKQYSSVIGSSAPYITGLAGKCGTYTDWHDADYQVDGSQDGTYVSKPNYATYFSGVSPSVHGLTDDSFGTTTNVDNIFNRMNAAGLMAKDYTGGGAGSCSNSNYSGAYHDPMRYFQDLGGQSSSSSTYCNTHSVDMGSFTTDLDSGNLPALSVILPTNSENMHDNSVSSGDSWAQGFLDPLLNSAQYKSGDTAVFFVWDEDTPIPNVLMAPSIKAGTKPVPSVYTFSHFSATRTWLEMLGLPVTLGDASKAPDLLPFFNGQ